jgi:hypothetical protein
MSRDHRAGDLIQDEEEFNTEKKRRQELFNTEYTEGTERRRQA